MLLTRNCYDMLAKKLYNMRYVEAPSVADRIDESRSNGSLDDNPEYYQALEDMSRLNRQIDELASVLNSSTIFTESMRTPDTVSFGSTVEFKNTDTNKKKKYTLVSVYDSDISNGFISVSSPFAKEMLGLHSGDYFYFNEDEYVITNICYSSL